MNITFNPLNEYHFPLLLKWLESSHVKAWWNREVTWTEELIRKKSESYVKDFKVLQLKDGTTITKPIRAFVIVCDEVPVGYIQYYNKHDFPSHHGYDSSSLPESCAGLDVYIGEAEYLGKGVGPQALKQLIDQEIASRFNYVFVDPEINNEAAIKTYGKVGFKPIRSFAKEGVMWMIMPSAVSQPKAENIVLCQLSSFEPIFHHPQKFGKNKEDIEKQMSDDFWEVGASGNIYTKEDGIKILVERYNDPDYNDVWEAYDFGIAEIAAGNYLVTYTLIQDKTRYTRRSTIWRKMNDDWKILYHQGTVMEKPNKEA